MEHAKGKWEIKETKYNSGRKVIMVQNQEHYVCEMEESYFPEEVPEYAYQVAKANARRICHAVNHFDELLEACKLLRGNYSLDVLAHKLNLNFSDVLDVEQAIQNAEQKVI